MITAFFAYVVTVAFYGTAFVIMPFSLLALLYFDR